MALEEKADGLTLTAVGCGNLGLAILSGISTALKRDRDSEESDVSTGHSKQKMSRFIACITREASAKRIEAELSHLTADLTVIQNDNVKGVQQADVVLLACKPYQMHSVLSAPGMFYAIQGKLVISILAGTSTTKILEAIEKDAKVRGYGRSQCKIVRAMPNTAALIGESMTVIALPDRPLSPKAHELVTWIFEQIGTVSFCQPSQMDVCTALCGSGPATYALVLEAMADGAVAMGLPRAQAQFMAAQTMRGTTGLVLNGEHPVMLREKVSTPGGCTIGGLLVLEEGSLRGTIARSVREATCVAAQLGQGGSNVNGTRPIPN